MDVRKIQKADLPACANLFTETFNASPWNERWSHEDTLLRISDNFHSPGFVGTLAEDDALLGFALGNLQRYESHYEFELKEMCVMPSRQGKGIGTTLLRNLKQHLKDIGVLSMYLLTARDTDAAIFYERNGFRDARRVKVMVSREQ